jgi:hypothetical protein
MNSKATGTIALVLICAVIPASATSRGHSSRRSSSHSYSSHSRSYSTRSHSYTAGGYRTRSSPSRPIHVRTYTRRNRTVVHSHSHAYVGTSTRSYARRASSSTHPRSSPTSSSGTRDSHGRIKRSAAAKDSFKRTSPCPSTGRSSGACPGYVIDHVKPLACGGADASSNMQWQTTAAAKLKDKTERQRCR